MRRLSDEAGAAAVLVAILILVLFGFAAFAVDVGVLYQERRELQNGADAAALAAAHDCASGLVSCSITALQLNTTVDDYANANANDSASAADVVGINLVDQTITVRTSTLTNVSSSSQVNYLTHFFAWALDHPTSTVAAEATAAWGWPSSLTPTLPLIMSYCDWDLFTTGGLNLPSAEEVITFHKPNTSNDTACPSGPAGMDSDGDGWLPGGFGWLDTAEDGCEPNLDAGGWVERDPGNNLPNSNTCDIRAILQVGETLLIPIFDDTQCVDPDKCIDGTRVGQIREYRVYGFAAFEVTGFRFPGYSDFSGTSQSCPASTSCLIGRFVNFVAPNAVELGGPDLGLSVVQLTR